MKKITRRLYNTETAKISTQQEDGFLVQQKLFISQGPLKALKTVLFLRGSKNSSETEVIFLSIFIT